MLRLAPYNSVITMCHLRAETTGAAVALLICNRVAGYDEQYTLSRQALYRITRLSQYFWTQKTIVLLLRTVYEILR